MNINNNNRNKMAVLTVVTILLITAVTVTALNQTVFAHKHNSKYNSDKLKDTQTLAQANNSENGILPVKVFGQNSASQVQVKIT
jgi:hypothetical protein